MILTRLHMILLQAKIIQICLKFLFFLNVIPGDPAPLPVPSQTSSNKTTNFIRSLQEVAIKIKTNDIGVRNANDIIEKTSTSQEENDGNTDDEYDVESDKEEEEIPENTDPHFQQLQESFNAIYESFKDSENETMRAETIKKKVTEMCGINFDDKDSDIEEYNFFCFDNYQWERRCAEMQVHIIHSRIYQPKKRQQSDQEKNIEQLHYKLIYYYESFNSQDDTQGILKCFSDCRTETDFAERFTKVFAGNLVQVRTVRNWLSQYKKDNKYTGQKTSIQKPNTSNKVTKDTILCLITLLLDFPFWTSKLYAAYINSEKGPNSNENDHITARTVRYYIKMLRFSQRRATLSNPARNCLGLTAARVVWAKIALDLANDPNVTICFVDECTVCYNNFGGGFYGFIGVSPEVVTSLHKFSFNMLAMVVPGFGVIYRLTTTPTTHDIYADFLKEAFKVVRALICDENQKLVIVHDNAKYHTERSIKQVLQNLNINELPTIQYSPQLNEPAECLFGFCKYKCQLANIGINTMKRKIQIASMNNWENAVKQYDARRSAIYYAVWKIILKRCVNGLPLKADHIHRVPDCLPELRDIKTRRVISKSFE